MRDADAAMSKGDWSAYGEAQTRLHDALNRAEAAQAALGRSSSTTSNSGSPTPSPSPSASATSGAQSGS